MKRSSMKILLFLTLLLVSGCSILGSSRDIPEVKSVEVVTVVEIVVVAVAPVVVVVAVVVAVPLKVAVAVVVIAT